MNRLCEFRAALIEAPTRQLKETMQFLIPESAIKYGFRVKPGGAHGSKTMMLREARLLFAASASDTGYAELQRLVLEENVLLKDTMSNREDVFKRLAQLYGLRQELSVYHALRVLWEAGEEDQPLLAVLCAIARDPLLRATATVLFDQPVGAVVSPRLFEVAVEAAFPQIYGSKTLLSISQNIAATWAQSGHLTGKIKKTRHQTIAGPAAVAYALLLAHLSGARGTALFESCWVKALDAAPENISALAFAASQRGWIEYRRIGNVAEVSFSQLLKE